MRIVRRGLIASAFKMRMTSMRNYRACAVIRSAGTGDPAIQVAAHHHHLVFQLRVGSWNLGDGVEAMLMVARKLGFHVHLKRDRHVVLE